MALAQKMEGMLCRWALAMQEYDFEIVYRRGSLNANADSLSRQVPSCATALAMTPHPPAELRISQQADQTTSKLLAARSHSNTPPRGHEWRKEPLRRYVQIWDQLRVCDGVLCRHYKPNPVSEGVTVPILPAALHRQALLRNHDAPIAGHQGSDKTLERLKQEAYWVGMAKEVQRHCRECVKCQQAKQTKDPN